MCGYSYADELDTLVRHMRNRAAAFGSQHSWWDVIGDIEAFMAGDQTIVQHTRVEWIAYAKKLLQRS
jgi:hypothetical protein